MKPFLSFQGSRAGFFSDLFTSRFQEAGLRIPSDRPLGHELEAEWLRAAVSPIPKSRKEQRPPASLSRNGFMVSLVRRMPQGVALPASGEISEHKSMGFFGVKRYPYPLHQNAYGTEAIIDLWISRNLQPKGSST
jgi:hypothetical protein